MLFFSLPELQKISLKLKQLKRSVLTVAQVEGAPFPSLPQGDLVMMTMIILTLPKNQILELTGVKKPHQVAEVVRELPGVKKTEEDNGARNNRSVSQTPASVPSPARQQASRRRRSNDSVGKSIRRDRSPVQKDFLLVVIQQ